MEIKFRVWNETTKKMSQGEIGLHNAYCFIGPVNKWMQFVGLTDDNDIPIFDGDIVATLNDTLTVEWNDDLCLWQFDNGQPINSGATYGTYKCVVGNIYEDVK